MTVFCFQAYDVVLRFEVQSPELTPFCRFCELPNWETLPETSQALRFRLWTEDAWYCYQVQDAPPIRLRRRLAFSRRLRSDCHLALAAASQAYVFVHAGVVRFADGGLLILPGRSRAGKSTLTHLLTQRGYGYFSDEYALVQPDGKVESFPRPLSLRRGESQRLFVAAEQLGWQRSFQPERARIIVETTFQDGQSWNPEPMTRSALLVHLLANSVTASTQPSRTIASLHALIQGAEGWRSARGHCEQVLGWLQLRWPAAPD